MIKLTNKERRKVNLCMKEMIERNDEVSYCGIISRDSFENYYNRKIFFKFTQWDHIGIMEEHEDLYWHFVKTKEIAEEIIQSGYLLKDKFYEEGSFGKVVYTYPAKSGRYFTNHYGILFKSKQKHFHVVDAENNCCVGEANFTEDVKLIEPMIINPEEVETMANKLFDWKSISKHYYGIPYQHSHENLNLEELPHLLNKILYDR